MPAEIVIVADVWAREDTVARVEELLAGDAEYTHAHEPGTLLFALHRDRDDPLHFVVVEAFADEGALAAHRASDFYAALMAELPTVVARNGRLVLEPLGAGDPARGHVA